MNIQFKLTLWFTGIVATILTIFSAAIYISSDTYRREEFYTRLESRALTTARLLVVVNEVDMNLLRIIDRNSIHALYDEKVLVFDPRDSLVYNSLDDLEIAHSPELIRQVREKGGIQYTQEGIENVGITYKSNQGDYVIFSSAVDRYGRSKLQNLRNVLWTGLAIGIMLTALTGLLFARVVLRPISNMNAEISKINAGNLGQRIDEGNQRDEIAKLAMNFNNMLARLKAAFGIQQQFVSNASHELRTPLAAMSTQLQLMLEKKDLPADYQISLQSLLDDTRTLAALANALLTLAQSDLEKQQLKQGPVRVDETLFAAQNDLLKAHPDYQFTIEYETFPEDESQLLITGSEQLLKTAFLNFMDNACKFSEDHTVDISLGISDTAVRITFKDRGIGILPEEQERVFQAFYRGNNTGGFPKGYGIGLSLCQRIVRLHNGTISLKSTPGQGSCFEVTLFR